MFPAVEFDPTMSREKVYSVSVSVFIDYSAFTIIPHPARLSDKHFPKRDAIFLYSFCLDSLYRRLIAAASPRMPRRRSCRRICRAAEPLYRDSDVGVIYVTDSFTRVNISLWEATSAQPRALIMHFTASARLSLSRSSLSVSLTG